MENKRENKKFYKKIIIVLLSAWLFMLIIPLNTVVYNKDGYSYEPQNYGFKNLAMPDLENKEYLGNGVYRLYSGNGITIDYEVNSGIFTINGTTNSNLDLKLGTTWLPNGNYYRTFYYISGTKNNQIAVWAFGESEPFDIYMGTTNVYNSQILTDNTFLGRKNTIYLYLLAGLIFDNYQFKLQIEKGDTATDYEVPIEPLIYHYSKGGLKNA